MRDILAFTDNYRKWGSSVRYAGELAALLEAPVSGMFVIEPIVPYSPSPIPVFSGEVYAATAAIAREAAAAEPEFKKFIAHTGVKQSRWLVGHGLFAAALANAGNWHDLLVAGSGIDSAWTSVGMLGQLILSCDLPCIVVPESFTKKATLDTVAIAWNGSSEAVRALHAALPLIKRAKQVLLLVGAQKESFSAVNLNPAFTPEDHLHQHDVQFRKQVFEAQGHDAGAKLLYAAEVAGADLLVMGAYGRTRFSEWVLGGATRHILQHASLPVLMRH